MRNLVISVSEDRSGAIYPADLKMPLIWRIARFLSLFIVIGVGATSFRHCTNSFSAYSDLSNSASAVTII